MANKRPGHLGTSERFYMPERKATWGGRPMAADKVWEDLDIGVIAPTGYQVTREEKFGLSWIETRLEAATPDYSNLFKIYVTPDWGSGDAYKIWRQSFSTVMAAVRTLSLFRFKGCLSPEFMHRADGLVLYVTASQLPSILGFLYGVLRREHAPSTEDLPTFAKPFPDAEHGTQLSYIQGEIYVKQQIRNPDWVPPGDFYTHRVLRSIAYDQLGTDVLDYQGDRQRNHMLGFGFDGSHYHLHVGTEDPVKRGPLELWEGFFLAVRKAHAARDPAKIAIFEAATRIQFAEAVTSLTRSMSPSTAGTQRKLILGLPAGTRALFRPESNRAKSALLRQIDEAGLDKIVAPFWCRRIRQLGLPPSSEGMRQVYEHEIGSPRREVAASRFAASLGSRLIPTVRLCRIEGEYGSVQILVDLVGTDLKIEVDPRSLESEFEEAHTLDYLLDNVDRLDNWEFTADGHLLLVDNTQVFGAAGKYRRRLALTSHRWRRSFVDCLKKLDHDVVGATVGEFLSAEEIDGLRRRIVDVLAHINSVLGDIREDEAFMGG